MLSPPAPSSACGAWGGPRASVVHVCVAPSAAVFSEGDRVPRPATSDRRGPGPRSSHGPRWSRLQRPHSRSAGQMHPAPPSPPCAPGVCAHVCPLGWPGSRCPGLVLMVSCPGRVRPQAGWAGEGRPGDCIPAALCTQGLGPPLPRRPHPGSEIPGTALGTGPGCLRVPLCRETESPFSLIWDQGPRVGEEHGGG